MKMHWKTLTGMLLLAMLFSSSNAWALSFGKPGNSNGCSSSHGRPKKCVPEIDAAGTLPALALLGVVVALVRERKGRK